MHPYLAAEPADFQHAADLLVAFNREYDEPAPEPEWLAPHSAARGWGPAC